MTVFRSTDKHKIGNTCGFLKLRASSGEFWWVVLFYFSSKKLSKRKIIQDEVLIGSLSNKVDPVEFISQHYRKLHHVYIDKEDLRLNSTISNYLKLKEWTIEHIL